MEDLMTQQDGTVRDATGKIVQFRYGEDGVNSTKIEGISLPLGKFTEEQIKTKFGLEGVDFSQILTDGTERGEDADLLEEFVEEICKDRRMLVEGVFGGGRSTALFAPLNIERLLNNFKIKFNLDKTLQTSLTPSTVLKGINSIIERTQPYNKIWAASLRYHLAPHKIIVEERFTEEVWETLVQAIVVKNWKSWAPPGELVGIVAAQSIGEPATQMTLNSVDWSTEILIAKNGKIITPKIGEFIDDYYMNCPETSKIQHLENGRIYIELNDGNDWKAVSCDEDGNMKWTKLEAITRHPVVNEDGTNTILEVELESGRKVKATKGKSFLTMVDGKITGTNGSDLKIGDELPIGNSIALNGLEYCKEINLRTILPPMDYLYGSEVEKALMAMRTGEKHWFQKNQGSVFTVPYSRSDSFRDAFEKGRNSNTILPGCVYNKHMKQDVSQIPETIPLTRDFGYFVGAYLAEGMSNATQITITNNDELYLSKLNDLMKSWNVGTHTVCEQRHSKKTDIKGTTTSLVIHSTILAKVMSTMFGRVSYEKTLPDWVLQADDEFIKGLIDAYICGDGTVSKRSGYISATSVSEDLLTRLGTLFARYGIYSTMSSRMPPLNSFNSVQRYYTLTIPVKYSALFYNTFSLTIAKKQEILNTHYKLNDKHRTAKWKVTKDVVWDKIKNITEVVPMGEGWVYDLTVEETRNFTCLNMIAQKDTFHQAGVAAKSAMTRGVPRLKELLKVTKNPKANSLTIALKPAFRNDKDHVREVVQDLELTLLRDIVLKAGIYYDPDDESTIIQEDKDVIAFFNEMQLRSEELNDKSYSKWIIRLEFDREKMFNKNITMDDVYFVVHNAYGYYGDDDDNIKTIYSDYNSQKLLMRIRPKINDNTFDDQLSSIKKFQNLLLNNTIIRGIHGIRAVTWRKDNSRVEEVNGKYEEVTQYLLDTDGTNFIAIMNHPAVDGDRLYSTNVHDIYEQLGIEATRATLYSEINSLFGEADINYRHLGLLCDIMTHTGRLMSADRYGINKMDTGPLAKACFEETEKILLRAALFGEMDPVTGVSANIMTGQPIRAGTGFTHILLDEMALPRMMEGLSPLEADEEEVEIPDQELINAELYGADNDQCSQLQTQMNMTLPIGGATIEEDDIEIVAL
jgi:DNA-directed RNA polymerase beta' subunit